jgi:hypothetical protein
MSKEETCLRWCVNVIRIAMPSVLGFDDGGHYVEKKQKMWFKKKIGLMWCANVVIIVMPNVLGFDDGGQYDKKKINVV